MDRKKFLKKGLVGLGTIVALPTVITSCSNDDDNNSTTTGDCDLSPSETAGPFPIITPAQLAQANIIGNRTGVALLITLTVQDQSDDCNPLSGVLVDLWHCDAEGNYSQYGGTQMQQTDYTNEDFLRGRQTTDSNGQVSFISIFPGWYMGRAPHIHVEILDSNENSLRVTQIAFPKDICDTVYATTGYNGEADTLNESDNVFSDSLDGNMLDSLTGNTTDGYTLLKTIVV
ncbi:intradiol ring-cleavage dioxygenase [Flavobacterium sp. CBA20B-1]|uniref:dioxygenase family protein n=1 Tax=unclassified Flavobacterium TaxID=196869 RepID=UPI0022258A84|nr:MULTISPECIES: intradiol ring-cleavage dioxygenase [unclassified Flavobacterium]WCM43185.1 intradiol ring-cleavage dioxygenase [Flavobacterium sp. CBA20B-1]